MSPRRPSPSKKKSSKGEKKRGEKSSPKRKSSLKNKPSYGKDFLALMEACPDAESLNARVITPFVQALVTVCNARGYVFNIYGDHCNIAVTPENHAEPLYRLINTYMDEAGLG